MSVDLTISQVSNQQRGRKAVVYISKRCLKYFDFMQQEKYYLLSWPLICMSYKDDDCADTCEP